MKRIVRMRSLASCASRGTASSMATRAPVRTSRSARRASAGGPVRRATPRMARCGPSARPAPPASHARMIDHMTEHSRSDEPVRVATVGLGYWGPNLARSFNSVDDSHLTWLCDLDEALLERVGRQLPEARRTTDLDEVLA